MSAAQSGATINPGIIEMQMSSVTAPRLGGGQVAHFIILLSFCPLLVWEEVSLEGCCVAMYNSCSNSCMSGQEREREGEREISEVDFVVCQKHIVCVCIGLHTRTHTHGSEDDGCTQPQKRSVRLGIQNLIKIVPSRRHLYTFSWNLSLLSPPCCSHTDRSPHQTLGVCSEFIGFVRVCGYLVVWLSLNDLMSLWTQCFLR